MKLFIALLLALPLCAQNLLMTSADKALLQSEVSANSVRWQTLKTDCDAFYNRPVRNLAPNMTDANYSEYASNGPFSYGDVSIQGGYEGGDLTNTILPLGACYQATIGNPGFADQARAAAYGAKAKDILMSVARPTAWMTRDIPLANIVVSNGTATVASAHEAGAAPAFFTIEVTGTGNATLDARQGASTSGASAFTFPTTAANGTYTPASLKFLISTDGDSGYNGVGRPLSILQAVKGTTTRLNTVAGSAYRPGQRVRVWGLQPPYDILNGTWTAATGTLNAVLMIPVDSSALTTTTTIPLGAYSAAIEEAFAISTITVGSVTTLTVSGASQAVGQNVRIWGLAAPYDVLNGTWTAQAGTTGTTLKIAYDSSAFTSGTIPSLTAFAGDLTRLRLNAQTLNGIHVGDLFTVTSVRGCTVANNTWKIAATSKPLAVTYPDGSPAPALEGECSYDAPRQSSDAGYHLRNLLPLLAIGYDWLAPLLTSSEKQAVVDKMIESFWITADGTIYPNMVHPMSNYYTSMVSGYTLADVAMGAQLPHAIHDWIEDRARFMLSYFNTWISGGGYPQGLRDYGNAEIGRIFRAALAKYKAGVDWRAAPYNSTWLSGTLNYFLGTGAPDGVQGDDYGYVSTLGGVQTSQDTRISAEATLGIAAWANAVGDANAAKFSKFHRETLAAVKAAAASGILPAYASAYQAAVRSVPGWDFVLERDWPEADWTPASLTYYGYSGDFAVSRTAWNDPNAVYLTLQGNMFLDYAPQGKQKMKLGEITIRRGGVKRLVGTADGFVARTNGSAGVGDLHNTNAYSNQGIARYNRFYNGLWASATALGGSQYYTNWCVAGTNPDVTDRTKIPSYNPNVTWVADSARPRVTVKVDQPAYSYWRVEKLECYYTYSATQVAPTTDHRNHVQSWTREVVFLRPSGLAVVRDASIVRDGTEDRFINWVVPKGGSIADVPGGKQFTVSNAILGGDIGAITLLRPAGLQVAQIDCVRSDQTTSYNACDRLEVRPAANNHAQDVFVAVLDPSGDLTSLAPAAAVPATNGEAYEIGTGSVVGWVTMMPFAYSLSSPSVHLHVIVGLSPGSVVYRSVTGNTFTLASTGGVALTVPASGVLAFTAGSDPAVPYITTSALPSVDQGSVYPEFALAAANGAPPYTFSVAAGALPSGMALASNGALSGAPTVAGTFTFTARVRDSLNAEGTTDLAIVVNPYVGNPVITTESLPSGLEGTSYSFQLDAASGAPPYSWSVLEGSACLASVGIGLSADGQLSGPALAAGTCDLLVGISDSAGRVGNRRLGLTVNGQAQNDLNIAVLQGSTAALVQVGVSGLSAKASCAVTILDGASMIVATGTAATGPARRLIYVAGLVPSTAYTAIAVCGSHVGIGPSAFTSRAAGGAASGPIHGASPPGATGMLVEYGPTFGASVTGACVAGRCTAMIPGASGDLVPYRLTWIGLGRVSDTHYALIP